MNGLVLPLEVLGKLKLVIVHQRRVGDDNQWDSDAQYFANSPGAWDERLVAIKLRSAIAQLGGQPTPMGDDAPRRAHTSLTATAADVGA